MSGSAPGQHGIEIAPSRGRRWKGIKSAATVPGAIANATARALPAGTGARGCACPAEGTRAVKFGNHLFGPPPGKNSSRLFLKSVHRAPQRQPNVPEVLRNCGGRMIGKWLYEVAWT